MVAYTLDFNSLFHPCLIYTFWSFLVSFQASSSISGGSACWRFGLCGLLARLCFLVCGCHSTHCSDRKGRSHARCIRIKNRGHFFRAKIRHLAHFHPNRFCANSVERKALLCFGIFNTIEFLIMPVVVFSAISPLTLGAGLYFRV